MFSLENATMILVMVVPLFSEVVRLFSPRWSSRSSCMLWNSSLVRTDTSVYLAIQLMRLLFS